MTDLPEEVRRIIRDKAHPLLLKMASTLPAEPDYEGRAEIVNGAIDVLFDYVRAALTAEGYMVVKGWRPIEEAPEGVPVITDVGCVIWVNGVDIIQDAGWYHCDIKGDIFTCYGDAEIYAAKPTHFAPLLPAPEEE